MDVMTVIYRTLFIYLFLLIALRLMGKREIGQLSILDFIVSIMIAEIAVISIENTDISMFAALTPIVVLFIIQVGSAYLSLKSEKARHILDGTPSIIINEGEINEKEMKKQRYNFDDLLMQLRENNIRDVSDVEFAILEPSGKLSVFEKEDGDDHSFPLSLIVDGTIKVEHLQKAGLDELWLRRELRKAGIYSFKYISYCSIEEDGTLYVDLKGE